MNRTYNEMTPEHLASCDAKPMVWRKLLFSLSFFHAVMQVGKGKKGGVAGARQGCGGAGQGGKEDGQGSSAAGRAMGEWAGLWRGGAGE